MPLYLRTLITLAALVLAGHAIAQDAPPVGDAAAGKTTFGQSCALCHSDVLAADNSIINKWAPASSASSAAPPAPAPGYAYTQALKNSGLKWDAPTLDKFLSAPNTLVPGTAMLFPVPDPQIRANIVAYLQSLKLPDNARPAAPQAITPAIPVPQDPGAWENAAPGVAHHITVADLPRPMPPSRSASVRTPCTSPTAPTSPSRPASPPKSSPPA